MSEPDHEDLVRGAQSVLVRNRRDEWTCPSVALYPHQWLWDSCFTAIGIARYDAPRAAAELRALFRGQWANGMVPHMIFADGSRDVGSRRVWQSRKHPSAPRDVATSCITQPPLIAIATERVARSLPEPTRRAFLAELYPKLVAYHSWCYDERDLSGSGLVTLIHPWECGLDSTPPWMDALHHMRLPLWLRTAERLHLARILRSLRYDTRLLPAAERASDDDGLRMLAVAVHAKRYGFELRRIPRNDEAVLIEDLAFNAMLAAANRSLEQIASDLGEELPAPLAASMQRTRDALEELWHEPSGQYCSRHAVTGEPLVQPTVATFLPLWAGTASGEHADRLLALLQRTDGYWPDFPVPSVPVDAPEFQEARYWKGPTWVNTNWAIVEGLRAYGADELADQLRRRTLELVAGAGFSEYFSALSGDGYGADDFSWTAALTIDLALSVR
ncbi:MAG: amylo-alpha-1,6-glucosidase [Acidimicrobiia bacterium]